MVTGGFEFSRAREQLRVQIGLPLEGGAIERLGQAVQALGDRIEQDQTSSGEELREQLAERGAVRFRGLVGGG